MKTTRLIGVGALALSLFACGSNSTGGGFGTNGPTEDNGSSGGASNGSSSATNASSGSQGSNGGNGSSGVNVIGAGSSGTSSSNGSSGSVASSGSSGTGSSGAASSSSGSSSGLTTTTGGDSGAGDDPDIDQTVAPITLSMTPFSVPAGGEVYYCQTFANPWGKQVDIKTYSLDMNAGSHHFFAFYQTSATNGVNAMCPSGGLTFGNYTFSAQAPQVTTTFPSTVGATLPAGTGFNFSVHYLNTTASTINANVKLTMWIAKAGAVTNHAGSLFLNQATMTVAASCTAGCQSVSSYTLPQDVELMVSVSHMHKYATNFIASASTGQTLYQTTQWDEPKAAVYSPPMHLTSGTSITWSCTDVNTTGQELTFGESANSNVMCISSSIFYPVSDVNNPTLGDPAGFTF